MSGPDPHALLERHKPLVRYDAQEAYFADSAAEWTDNLNNRLISSTGEVLAAAGGKTHRLSLSFLAAGYEGSSADDAIACSDGHYAEQYAALRTSGDYRNRVYGRVAADSQGATWLQYWFFYFYNDAGFLGFGAHEGDWEMVQLRLGDDGPDVAVYAQHKEAEARPFGEVERAPGSSDRPVVYSARGSHASYYTSGKRWTGVWFDHAGGDGFCPELELEFLDGAALGWAAWPGRWGGTRARNPAESDSPGSPIGHKQWRDPLALHQVAAQAKPKPPPQATPPPAPEIHAERDGRGLRVAYSVAGDEAPTSLVVHVNSPDDRRPPRAHTIKVDDHAGVVHLPGILDEGKRYEVTVSAGNRVGSGEAAFGRV